MNKKKDKISAVIIILFLTVLSSMNFIYASTINNTSLGVLTLKGNYKNTPIEILNSDKTVWYKFVLSDNFKTTKISPFAIKADDVLLVFRIVGQTNDSYKIIINETTTEIKFISKHNKNFEYQSWERHLLTVFSIDFEYNNNPLRSSPNINAHKLKYDRNQFYHPIKVKNEWIQVEDDNSNRFWLKWKDNKGNLIITLYYSA